MYLLHYLRGFVRVSVRGMYCSRVLSDCIRLGIPVYQPVPQPFQELHFTVRAADFPRLCDPIRKNACHLHILRRGGLPFHLHVMRRRLLFFAGLLLCALLCWTLTGFVWSFEVQGCETLSSTYILRLLAEEGIVRGVPVSAIDPPDLRNRILCREHRLIFLTIRTEGSHAVVEVRERREAPTIFDDDTPCDLTASRAGLVTSVILRQGTALVSPGSLVEAGDILVRGVLRYSETSPKDEKTAERPIRSDAQVFARVWTKIRLICPTNAAVKCSAAETRSRYALVFGGFRWNLYFSRYYSDAECDIIITRKTLRLPGGFTLPLTLIRETLTPYTLTADTEETVTAEIRETLEQEALARLEYMTEGSALTVNAVKSVITGGALHTWAIGETVEDIAAVPSA